MKLFFRLLLLLVIGQTGSLTARADAPLFGDSTRAFAVPTLTKTPHGTVALSWTEKDQTGMIYFYWAESRDRGQTFGDKKLIFSSAGLGNSRLMRPKLLFRPDGTVMAVFGLRGSQPIPAAPTPEAEHHNHGAAPMPEKPRADGPANRENQGGGRSSDLQIVFCQSTDGGMTWTQPVPVHEDKTPNVVRGFFDATVLANGEVAVAYLSDIQGRQHERDLRFVTTTGGRFGAEKTLDPFVCDCCNISLLVDGAGALHVYYRENQENIRDIARMSSTDNGATFSSPGILSADSWKINGCPHSGPTSSAGGGANLVAWFSGTTDSPGIRVVDQAGQRLFVLADASAKNAYLVPAPASSVLLWEQGQTTEAGGSSVIAFRNLRAGQLPVTQLVSGSANGTNATGLVTDGQLVVAYEVRTANKRNGMAIARVAL